MFFSEDEYKKYSLFGTFEKELKRNEFNLNESKFEVLPFLNYCQNDTNWYHQMVERLIDKDQKLSMPYNRTDSKRKPYNAPRTSYPRVDETKSNMPLLQPHPVEHSEPFVHESALKTEVRKPTQIVEKVEEKKPAEGKQAESENKSPKGTPNTQNSAFFRMLKYWYPLRFKLNYPKRSLLNAYEQKEYLEFHERFRSRTTVTQSEVKLYKKYAHYKNLAEKERKEFLAYMEEYFKLAKEDYEFMNNYILRYVNEMINYSESNVNQYDRYFAKLFDLSLTQLDMTNQQRSALQFQTNLLQMGNIPKVILPQITLDKHPDLVMNYEQLSKRVPVAKGSKKLSKIPLSQDENVSKLAEKYSCSFVLTNSAFVHLIYNLAVKNDEDLKLPMIIKNITNADGTVQKLIFFEKPFMQKALSKREINEKFYKKSLMVTLVKASNVSRFKKHNTSDLKEENTSPPPTTTTQQQQQNSSKLSARFESGRKLQKSNVDYNSINNLESFGFLDKDFDSKPIHSNPNYTNQNEKDHLVEENSSKDPLTADVKNKPDENLKRTIEEASNESGNLSAKKPKLNEEYEDYSDYDEDGEEEEKLLMIDYDEEHEKEPSKLNNVEIEMETEPIPAYDDNVPKSPPSASNEEYQIIQPKVIPLDKNVELAKSSPIKLAQEKPAHTKTTKLLNKPVETEEKLSLFDLISKMQEKLINVPSSTASAPTPTTTGAAPGTVKSSLAPVENSKDFAYIDNVHDNVNYNMWSLNTTNAIKILVRYSIDGYVNTETSSLNKVVLYPKLEYQPQFGCEKVTTKEQCVMWAKSFIRNSCDVYLCRINVFTNKLISITPFKHNDLLPKDSEFNPNAALNHMRSLFERFIHLDEGHYLLSKEPNQELINVLKSKSAKTGVFDLHLLYSGFATGDKVKQPVMVPIDTNLLLPYHRKLNRVPCLFEPVYSKKNKSPQTPSATTKKKNKRKRKSKAKKPE